MNVSGANKLLNEIGDLKISISDAYGRACNNVDPLPDYISLYRPMIDDIQRMLTMLQNFINHSELKNL